MTLSPQRTGRFTASMFKDLFATKSTVTYRRAIASVAFKRLTGESPEEDSFSNKATERGHELEPVAIQEYERLTFRKVRKSKFYIYDDWTGASPDGEVGEGGLEVKCPYYNTHIYYLIKGELPKEYFWQVHGQMLCTGWPWIDFFSWHPKLRPLLLRVDRNEDVIKQLKAEIMIARGEVEKILELL